MAAKGQIKHTQLIKLKKDQFNFILLAYLRQVKKEQYFGKESLFLKLILLS